MAYLNAEEAGHALRVIGEKLQAADILTVEGAAALRDESFRLAKLKKETSWTTRIARERAITFERVQDKDGAEISIALSAERIVIDQDVVSHPPFVTLDVAVAITNAAGEPVCRWHLDRANIGQQGPLFHLQMGGHLPGFRDRELPIAEPRWCHPPLELGLLCEVLAANFFPAKWARSVRDDPAWCDAIRRLQKLCFTDYVARLTQSLAVSESTALARMWNGSWV
ncbi:hypothetical protein [Erythrobacter neustonensis]|uniref:hypothetical protein n=1 Tax=Erythrobacter neustonensis TaxID=1112 RepID=UPI000A82E644|nr:hypothetical protein [Erythrobacter neustonensis]